MTGSFLSKYIGLMIRALRSQYRVLIFQLGLNPGLRHFPAPEINITGHSGDWMIINIAGFDYHWPPETKTAFLGIIFNEVFTPFNKNPHAYEAGKVAISRSDWVIDAGASEGFFVRYALERGANVLAVEPIQKFAEALKRTYSREILEGRVLILNAGLGARPGTARVNIRENMIFASTVSEVGGEGEIIPITTVDEILEKGIIPTVNFIKMDIEGAENSAMRGAEETLRKLQPKLSIAVYHEYDNARIVDRLVMQAQPAYRVSYRGLLTRQWNGLPRPWMLHAYCRPDLPPTGGK